MIKITHLEGYSGLRLKDNKPVEIRKGLNLLVGRNGSGKSNFTKLIQFVFQGPFSNENLLESTYIDNIIENTKRKYTQRVENERSLNLKVNNFVTTTDFETKEFLRIRCNDLTGALRIRFPSNNNSLLITQFEGMVRSQSVMQSNTVEKTGNLDNLVVVNIKPDIQVSNDNIVINGQYSIFRPSTQNGNGNQIVNSIINNFNSYFNKELRDFLYTDKRIQEGLEQIRKDITNQYNSFFGQTQKEIHITINNDDYRGRALFLKEGEDFIDFAGLSDGEKNLLNLIIGLEVARYNKPDIIIIDEPELFMHDDMIKAFVKEISNLSTDLPESYIITASHSSTLIEEFANIGKEKVNLIAINNKKIYNSIEDIEFINALRSNGVVFSPLYLSKRPNLFIENNVKSGDANRAFFSQFFAPENQPNIILVGSSGQVKEYDKYVAIMEDIIKTQTDKKTLGIIDGDIWFCEQLKPYLFGKTHLEEYINILNAEKDFYIKHSEKKNTFYFNCWEIENLYLLEEVRKETKHKETHRNLEGENYIDFLVSNKEKLIDSWLKTYTRFHFKPIYIDKETIKSGGKELETVAKEIIEFKGKGDTINQKLSELFDKLIQTGMLDWMPGKEIVNMLDNYELGKVIFSELKVTEKIRAILN